MPRVEFWLGNEKKTIHVREEEMSDYIRIHEPLEPLCAYPPEPFDHRKEVSKILTYKIDGWKFDPETGERVYKAVQV